MQQLWPFLLMSIVLFSWKTGSFVFDGQQQHGILLDSDAIHLEQVPGEEIHLTTLLAVIVHYCYSYNYQRDGIERFK